MSVPATSLILEPAFASAAMVNAGFNKTRLPTGKMIILGCLAGIYIGFGCQVYFTILAAGGADGAAAAGNSVSYGPASGALKYFGGFAFSAGLMAIIICGAELFTGNCLIIMAVLAGRVSLKDMLFDWFVVYFSNLLGSIMMAVIIYGGGVNGYYSSVDAADLDNRNRVLTRTGEIICTIAHSKAEMEPHEMFFRGIPANLLVCIAVLQATASKSAIGKIFSIGIPIATFICCGFSHSIADMGIFSAATLLNCQNGKDHGYYWIDLILVTLGNIIGASILAVSYWATYIDVEKTPDTTSAIQSQNNNNEPSSSASDSSPNKLSAEKREDEEDSTPVPETKTPSLVTK